MPSIGLQGLSSVLHKVGGCLPCIGSDDPTKKTPALSTASTQDSDESLASVVSAADASFSRTASVQRLRSRNGLSKFSNKQPQQNPGTRKRRNTNPSVLGQNEQAQLMKFVRSNSVSGSVSDLSLGTAGGGSVPNLDIDAIFKKFCRDKANSFMFEDFETCVAELKLELDNVELRRLFTRINTARNGSLTIHEFKEGFANDDRFRCIVTDYHKEFEFRGSVSVAADYDFTEPTTEAYAHEDYLVEASTNRSCFKTYDAKQHGELYGVYAGIRTKLDFTYHVNYTERRQAWQDRMVSRVARCTSPRPRPWVVFTCGAMGAGKGHVMTWLSKQNIFPLEDIVHIDPDHFKRVMPEWPGYTKNNQLTAGTMCHDESGLMQELAQEVALQRGQNVWIDGSLRNHAWYAQVFADIRVRFPTYRVAVFYVHCSFGEVIRRAEKRGHDTGRFIPEERLRQSVEATKTAIMMLAPLADFVARIDNEDVIPSLESCEDRTRSFMTIQSTFKLHQVRSEFPLALPPLKIQRHQGLSEKLRLVLPKKLGPELKRMASKGGQRQLHSLRLQDICVPSFAEALEEQARNCSSMTLLLSPFAELNFDQLTRQVAGMPQAATRFAFCHGCFLNGPDGLVLAEWPPILLRLAGSWFYLDAADKLCGVFVPYDEASQSTASSLFFSKREVLGRRTAERLAREGRWMQPATVPQNSSAARIIHDMAWLMPEETAWLPYGGMAYRLKNHLDEPFVFPVRQSE
eukprot:TRINITY_DN93518_c0_g1_i1.p1 TRINITY_DN93518_c0_g1~~TRINITY_DN93518_c0_g1_i1.p1  ORF type:complete len:743 (+),score=111.75 TRINITY_DN93518_c0_g1_i1:76-2304(+)